MRIVVTGSESFIGKELIAQCLRAGIEVFGIDLLGNLTKKYEYKKADIRSLELAQIFPKGADAIVHLAALSRDTDCRDKPQECFDVNVIGTLNVMRAAEECGARQFIFASSEWVYDNCSASEVKTEESPINIFNHDSEYALSKLVSEANLKQKFNRGFCPVAILRFGIIYGPRTENFSAVESLFNSVKEGDYISVGSLETGRKFVHVRDIASGIIKSIGLAGFNVINLTGDEIITLREIIETSENILDKKVSVTEKTPGSVSIRNPSNEKAKKLIRWSPEINLEEGLKSLTTNH